MKKRRLAAIVSLIQENRIDTQEELLLKLRQSGFNVTQATVSRDINELGIIKKPDGGSYRYALQSEQRDETDKFRHVFSAAVIGIDYAMNDVIIKCHSGMASGAAEILDNMDLPEIVGTLAGDDTILAVVRTEADAKKVAQLLRNM